MSILDVLRSGKTKKSAVSFAESDVPRHIAIIMDGNGRWAQRRGLPRSAGHAAGAETFRRVATYCRDIGVEYLTVYAFSTENWKRSADEVGAIMNLLEQYLTEALRDMEKNRIRINFFGDLSLLSPRLRELADRAAEKSKSYDGIDLNLCINYGGRAEILRAVKRLASECADGELAPETLTEEDISSHLWSCGIPDPDLIIRPGGELRLSNFLMWQSAYSELYFTDVLWPDFGADDIDKAVQTFAQRSRRYGGV